MQKPTSSTICRPDNQDNIPHVQRESDEKSNDQFRLIDLIDDMCAGKDVFFQFVRAVKDIMPNSVKTLTLDDTVGKALEFMKQSGIRHVCVVDIPIGEEKKPYFVGIVSERDIFRQIPPNTEEVKGTKTNPKVKRQLLGQVVTRKPKTVSPETTIVDMLSTMLDNHVDMVPVLDGEDLVSVVTTSDIMKLIVRFDVICWLSSRSKKTSHERNKTRSADQLPAGADDVTSLFTTVFQTVKNIMTEQVACLGTDENLAAAMEAIKNGEFRHIPIVDTEGAMVGILSDRDVLRHLPFVGSQRLPGTDAFRSSLFHVDMRDPSLNLPITSIMTRNVTHIRQNCSFYDAVKMLHELKISCLPVVDKDKKLRGIVTVTDVMRALLGAYELVEKSWA
ncbi:MAG: CBS domain-containing protein [Planctomycetota bacterium]|jgi:CBS domain-containing protein